MEGEMEAFDFDLARHLHRTIAELDAMPLREYIAWRAFVTYRSAMDDFERQTS